MEKKPVGFCRSDKPPSTGRVIPVERILGSTEYVCVVLSKQLFGLYTHWNGRHTVPCVGEQRKQCSHCQAGLPRRWVAYLHVLNAETNSQRMVELTTIGASMLLEQAPGRRQLRGLIIRVARARGNKKSPLNCHVVGEQPAADKLPPEKSPEPTLCKLWGRENLR